MATTKKVQKVDTPIDERETFVSLQKNFAEDGLAVAEKLRILYDLQQADNAIDRIENLRGELPREVAALQKEVESCKARIAKIDELIEGYQSGIEANKQNIIDIDAELERLNAQLANAANSREFDTIQKEIENQGLLRLIAEKNIGEARVAISERKDDIVRVSEKITTREADLKAKEEELAQIKESTAKDEEVFVARRDALAAKLDARTISAYNRIRGSVKNHQAVVNVFNDSCGGCFSAITPQRLIDIAGGQKLIICEHCGRILVNFSAEDAKSE